ncbi:MAG: MBL fold metallo-hydrolase [Elusimicrobiota bacterium]
MKIKFCGASGGDVTGSKHLISFKGGSILLDAGLFQGRRKETIEKNLNFPFLVDDIDGVIISHSHIDHIGVLPVLVKKGFNKGIYLNRITAEISRIMLLDSARLQKEDAKFYNKIHPQEKPIEPIYDEEDVQKVFGLFKTFERGEFLQPIDGVYVKFINAGHVLGSSSIVINDGKNKILYTGDIGRQNQLLLKSPDIEENIDWLIMETTYGDRDHDDIKNVYQEFSSIIEEAIKNKSKIIIPSFSLERTQEIIYLIDMLIHEEKFRKIDVYVDSPMSVRITDIFNKNLGEVDFNVCFKNYTRFDKDPFGYEYIKYISSREESQRLNQKEGPMIIISASGMCEGGRILHHIRNSIDNEKNILLIVGYQAENTLGRRLKDGAKKVKIFGLEHNVFFKVRSLDFFSAHAGRSDLLDYVMKINPQKGIFLVHGEEKARTSFKFLLKENGFKNVFTPDMGEEFEI